MEIHRRLTGVCIEDTRDVSSEVMPVILRAVKITLMKAPQRLTSHGSDDGNQRRGCNADMG
jgi:hypothetical protein